MAMKKVREYFNKGRIKIYESSGVLLKDKELAELIDVQPTTFSGWMNTVKGKPSAIYLPKIASVFGEEIYEIVGEPRPEPQISFGVLPSEIVAALRERSEAAKSKIESVLTSMGLTSDMPESIPIVKSILAEFGIDVNKTVADE